MPPAMPVTKNLAELCVLLVDEQYGELPSRTFACLLSRGRSTLPQIAKNTSLTLRQVKHGIAVLIQYSLLFFQADEDGTSTWYEANTDAAYDLIRIGKVLDMVGELHGPAARDVVQSLQSLGQARVSDLQAAYRAKIQKRDKTQEDGAADTSAPDEDAFPRWKAGDVRSVDHLNVLLRQLFRADVVEVITLKSFQTAADSRREVEDEVTKKHFAEGVKGTKQKELHAQMVSRHLREIREMPKRVKRALDRNGHNWSKLRKLVNGDVANGYHDGDDEGEDEDEDEAEDDAAPTGLDAHTVLRVNYERCMVDLRNQHLARIATETIGETTGRVYAVLLRLVTETIPRCRIDPGIDVLLDKDDTQGEPRSVSTDEIFRHLGSTTSIMGAIGKSAADRIDVPFAEKLQKQPPGAGMHVDGAEADGDGSADEDGDEEEEDEYDSEADDIDVSHQPTEDANGTKESKEAKVTFEDTPQTAESRLSQMRQHLLLLCENRLSFARHCGRGLWTVDFRPLLRKLQEMELDAAMDHRVGRYGLRLARILRENGKLDEKTLPGFAMMKKGDVQNKTAQMQLHGFAEVQEVPRDNSRQVNRTMFFWYCSLERAFAQQLDNTYKAMLRALQVREQQRQENEEVLAFVERPDVKGREEETMEKKYLDKYEKYRDMEKTLVGQALKMDDTVAILRDY